MDKILKGTYLVEKNYNLIWLKDDTKKINQTIKYFDFDLFLHQSFNESQIKKILEALNCGERLLIDFDKEKVKIITTKDDNFFKEMNKYMTSNAVQNIINNEQEFNWLTFGIDYKKD